MHKLQAAVGPGDGTIHALERVQARREAGREGICQQICELIELLEGRCGLSRSQIERVGIGFGGPVDSKRGVVIKSHQVEGWEEFPICQWIGSVLGLEAVLGNDADLAGLAEAHFGAGCGFSPVVYTNIGSGIGGSLVVNGELYQGQGTGSLEVGHLRMVASEVNRPWQTLESLASGWSLAETARAAAEEAPKSVLASGGTEAISTEILADAVRQNDAVACGVWDNAIKYLAVAMANVITLLHPQCYVIGGGVSLVGELLFEPLRREVARQVFGPFVGTYRIVPAELGESVVVQGALKLARDADELLCGLGV